MKVRRRGENSSGHWIVSVRAKDIDELESAAGYLEEKLGGQLSPFVVDLVKKAAWSNGWRPAAHVAMPSRAKMKAEPPAPHHQDEGADLVEGAPH